MARPVRKGASKGVKGGGRRKPAPWVWMTTGLVVGLFVAFLVFLTLHERPTVRTPAAKERTVKGKEKEKEAVRQPSAPSPAPQAAAPGAVNPPEKKPMNYDFYQKLPRFEVEVPEAKNGARPKPLSDPGSYILQAGSFRNAGEADARKAQLALLGIISSVQTVHLEGKPAYHRVRVGPYRDLDRLNQVRQTLRDNHIEFVTLKERS